MGSNEYQDEETLREMYHDDGMSQQKIADRFGVGRSTISRWLRKHDIETKDPGGGDPNAPWKDEDRLRRMYHGERMYLGEIADELGTDESTLRHWMDKFDIERIPMGPKVSGVRYHTDSNGYVCVSHSYRGDEHRVRLHRLIAAAKYGLDAIRGMEVHHRNGFKVDNRPSNITIETKEDHARHHAMETEFWKYRDDLEVAPDAE